jgi:hypothetical protein
MMRITPFWWACCRGEIDVVRAFIACGRTFNPSNSFEWPIITRRSCVEIARDGGHHEVASLVEQFIANQDEVRRRVRMERVADNFATVVFLCDDLLRLRKPGAREGACRFFSIASALPIELQMVLCLRLNGMPGHVITAQDFEAAFRRLAREVVAPPERHRRGESGDSLSTADFTGLPIITHGMLERSRPVYLTQRIHFDPSRFGFMAQ